MDEQQRQLYERILAYPLDDSDSLLKFSDRLARENGWSSDYTRRVVREYQKFVFLALTAGHTVTPSDQVDQAWHMHLTYTRSYWDEFCREVLGKPLHHGPTRGGHKEQVKYIDLYQRTKESYRQLFEAEPPADIWPDAATRFGSDLHYRRVNLRRCWIIPRPGDWIRPTGMVAMASAPLLLGLWSPFGLNGQEFLKFYGLLLGFTILAALAVRHFLRSEWGEQAEADQSAQLDPYELAHLVGGRLRALQTATAALFKHDLIATSGTSAELRTLKSLPANAHYLECAVFEALAKSPDGMKPAALRTAVSVELEDLSQGLVKKGLVETATSFARARWCSLIVVLPVLAIGLARLQQGMQRERPVGFLIVLLVATAAAMLWLGIYTPRRTLAADRLVNRLKWQREEAQAIVHSATDRCVDSDVATSCALLGLAAVYSASDPLSQYYAQHAESSSWGGGGCGGGGCGGGGCGGGGCGGGGCGGGGCGGCGG